MEFLLRSGDIEEGQGMHDSLEAMQQGGKIHRKLQKKEGLSYHAEVPLKILIRIMISAWRDGQTVLYMTRRIRSRLSLMRSRECTGM